MAHPRLTTLATITRATADHRGGSGQDSGRVAEIVTFALVPGTIEQDFVQAAQATLAPLSGQAGFLGRQLSKGPDGRWTDHVLWSDMATAQSAAKAVMADPAFGPFLAAIDMGSLTMRHEDVALGV